MKTVLHFLNGLEVGGKERVALQLARRALESFNAVWDALFPSERSRLLHLLIDHVVYDQTRGHALIALRRPEGLVTVAYDVTFRRREGSALVARKRPTAKSCAATDVPAPAVSPVADAHPTARLLALAHRVERMVATGELRDYREAATRLGISHARMSQVMAMLLLSPAIQADILLGRVAATEGGLRRIVTSVNWSEQHVSLR